MKERRTTVARVAGLAESLASAMRRRQQGREPRVLLYDAGGNPRLLSPEAPAHGPLVDAADRLIELAAFPAAAPAEVEVDAASAPEAERDAAERLAEQELAAVQGDIELDARPGADAER